MEHWLAKLTWLDYWKNHGIASSRKYLPNLIAFFKPSRVVGALSYRWQHLPHRGCDQITAFNRRHVHDYLCCMKMVVFLILISLKFVPKGPVDNKLASGNGLSPSSLVYWHMYASLGLDDQRAVDRRYRYRMFWCHVTRLLKTHVIHNRDTNSVTQHYPTHDAWWRCLSSLDPHDDVIKHFQRYWPFVRGIHRWIPLTKAVDAELWSASEQTVEQTHETPVI